MPRKLFFFESGKYGNFHIVSSLWHFLLHKLNSSRGNYSRGGNYSRKYGIWYMSILLHLLKTQSMVRNLISRINSKLNKTKDSLFFYLFFLIKFGTIVSILINQDAIWYDGINQFLSTKSRLALITVMYQILGQLQPEPKYSITRYS